jgi:hypothetical protein
LGAIQVPADGQPIILLADRQTTGGYAKIAVVLKEDVYRLAQTTPGQVVHFRQMSVEEAQASLWRYEARFQALQQAWQSEGEHPNYILQLKDRSYRVDVEGGEGTYQVSVQEQADRKREGGEEI